MPRHRIFENQYTAYKTCTDYFNGIIPEVGKNKKYNTIEKNYHIRSNIDYFSGYRYEYWSPLDSTDIYTRTDRLASIKTIFVGSNISVSQFFYGIKYFSCLGV